MTNSSDWTPDQKHPQDPAGSSPDPTRPHDPAGSSPHQAQPHNAGGSGQSQMPSQGPDGWSHGQMSGQEPSGWGQGQAPSPGPGGWATGQMPPQGPPVSGQRPPQSPWAQGQMPPQGWVQGPGQMGGAPTPEQQAAWFAGGGPPTSPPRQRRTSLLWLWILLGVLVLVGIAAALWFFVIRPSAVVGSSANVVTDIRTTPEKAWTQQYVQRGNEDWVTEWPTTISVGSDRIAVLAELDSEYYASQTESNWYEGYDEDYATGYDDGIRYSAALEVYYEDETWEVDYPEREDYFSLSGVSYGSYEHEEREGWYDGFGDGEDDLGEGTNQAQRPDTPPTFGSISVVDTKSGNEVWSVGLDTLGIDSPEFYVSLRGPSPEGHLTLVSSMGYTNSLTLQALSLTDGSVVSTVDLEGDVPFEYGDENQSPLLVVTENSVRRLHTEKLGGDPVWSAAIDGIFLDDGTRVYKDYVEIPTEDGRLYLDTETGQEMPWFSEADPDTTYEILDDVVLRLETSSFGYYIDALTMDGKTLWTGDVETYFLAYGSGGDVLLRSEVNEDGEYEYLMRLDLKTGETMWEREYDGGFDYVWATAPGKLLLPLNDQTEVVDLISGERQFKVRGDVYYMGTTAVYGGDDQRVRAWDLKDGSELWSMRLADSEELKRVGNSLFLLDTARGTLSLLQE